MAAFNEDSRLVAAYLREASKLRGVNASDLCAELLESGKCAVVEVALVRRFVVALATAEPLLRWVHGCSIGAIDPSSAVEVDDLTRAVASVGSALFAAKAAGFGEVCHLCEAGFPLGDGETHGVPAGVHYGSQSKGMIPNTPCASMPSLAHREAP